jgi:hypothetical protein
MPALAAAAERLARDGVLAAPLAAGGGTAVGSFLLALASLSEKDVAGAKVVWLSSAAREARAEEPPASPFPVTLPAVRAAGTREALAGEVRAAVAALGAGQTAQ